MIEDKLPLNEETEKFKQAVDVFHEIRSDLDWPVETYLLLPLMFYLAKEHMLKIMEGDNINPSTLILASLQNTHLLVDKKDISPTIEEMIFFSQKKRGGIFYYV